MTSLPSTATVGRPSHAVEIAVGATSSATVARIKRVMLWGLALLWLLDAALQAQPRMFTIDFVSNIMKPSIAISPSFIEGISTWTLGFVSPHIALFNWLFMLTQFTIALTLIVGLLRHHGRLITAGLVLSLLWGSVVWIAGEGTSGVFTGNGTMFTGAPGAVLLYMAIAVFYLLPDKWWRLGGSFCLPRDFLAIVFLYGGVAQAVTPGFWGSRGISVLIEGQASMAPSWMISTMTPLAAWTHQYPVLSNAFLVGALLALAGLLYGRHPKTAGFVLMVPVLAVMWYWGQAFGGIFSGMGTDPNTIPPLLILAIPAYLIWHSRHTQGMPSAAASGAESGQVTPTQPCSIP